MATMMQYNSTNVVNFDDRPIFIHGHVWTEIYKAIRSCPGDCQVAVAYFGNDAAQMMPLTSGSRLVVDMGEDAVKAGLVNPTEIGVLLDQGVAVYSAQKLHAKVFVVGSTAFIGSMNVSNQSRFRLIEACVKFSHPTLVSECRKFVLSLCGNPVTPSRVAMLQKLYRPPRFPGGRRDKMNITSEDIQRPPVPDHPPVWAVFLADDDLDVEDKAAIAAGLPAAKQNLHSEQRYRVNKFIWWKDEYFLDRIRKWDITVRAIIAKNGVVNVWPPAPVLSIRRYKKGRQRRIAVFVEEKLCAEPTPLRDLPSQDQWIGKLEDAKLIDDSEAAHDLLSRWPDVMT